MNDTKSPGSMELLPDTPTMIDVADLPITAEAYAECRYSREPLQFVVKEMGKMERSRPAITPESLAEALWDVEKLRLGRFTQSQFLELCTEVLKREMGGKS